MDDLIGRLVISLAGRDKGKMSVVVGISEPGFVLIADGRGRKAEAPKKKKLKHVSLVEGLPGEIGTVPESRFTNRFIREAVGAAQEALSDTPM